MMFDIMVVLESIKKARLKTESGFQIIKKMQELIY